MAVTDLLSRIPNPPARRPDLADASGDGGAALGQWAAFSAPAEFLPPAAARPGRSSRRSLPSWVVLALASAALAVIALVALTLLRVVGPDTASGVAPTAFETVAATPADRAPAAPAETTGTAAATFGTDPTPVPADVIARLEAASNEPLHAELAQLLAAIGIGFGGRSAQVDPALRPYTVRMASRFEYNPDTFRIAVAAPSAELAAARVATLTRVFGDAVAAQRLLIEPTTGPDAITLAPR